MAHIVPIFLISFLFASGSSIKCVSEMIQNSGSGDWFKKNRTTCEGDYCVSYLGPYGYQIDKACNTGFPREMGCWKEYDFDYQTSACACNTTMCNSVKMAEQLKKLPTETLPHYQCHDYKIVFGGNITEEQLNTTHNGTWCTVRMVIGEKTSIERGSTSRLPMRLNEDSTSSFSEFAHLGGVYAETDVFQNLVLLYQCRGDFCNRDFHSSWLAPREDVECHSSDLYTKDVTCKGEYCAYYTDPSGIQGNHQYCLTANLTNAEGNLSIGIHKSRSMTIYICKGYYCNKDQETARKWIEDYGKGLVHAGTPIYGEPLNVENVAAKSFLFFVFIASFYHLLSFS